MSFTGTCSARKFGACVNWMYWACWYNPTAHRINSANPTDKKCHGVEYLLIAFICADGGAFCVAPGLFDCGFSTRTLILGHYFAIPRMSPTTSVGAQFIDLPVRHYVQYNVRTSYISHTQSNSKLCITILAQSAIDLIIDPFKTHEIAESFERVHLRYV